MPENARTWKEKIQLFFNRNPFWRKFLKITGIAIAATFAGVVLFIVLVWAGVFGKIPGKDDLTNIQHPIASEVYSADSVLLGRYYLQQRTPVDAKEIPDNLKNALIATEDARFFDHHGVDYRSLFRVLFKSILLQDEGSGGGSTLTQQLAKNLFPRKSHGPLTLPVNKVKEFIIAGRLEKAYSKEELIVLYLNTIPFADNTFGIKTAADRFFSVPVKELSVDQSAVLVGMLKATHYYNPRLFPERSLQRRNVVISQMEKYGFLNEAEEKSYQEKALNLKYNPSDYSAGLAPYFRAYMQKELIEWCKEHTKEDGTPYNLYTDGLKIYTTIDSKLQTYGEEAMRAHMKELQKKFTGQLNKRKIESLTNVKIKQIPQYKALIAQGLTHEKAIEQLKKKFKTKIFTWDGEQSTEISIYDSLKHHLQFLQTGVMAMEPQTGDIKVWIGGIDHKYFKFDHVRESTKRQVGSTIKPLIYATALESGINPCSYISARKTSYTNMEDWTPSNTSKDTYDKKYSMEGGLAGSVNTVSVKLLEKTGINNAIAMVRRMGVNSELEAVPSLALGTPSISVVEMVNAYSVLANDGQHNEPRYLTAIVDRDNKTLEVFKNKLNETRALSAESSRLMVQMLKSVISEGTGSSLRTRYGLTNDIAGKTGTTQSNVDGWFIAIMPKLVIGTWVGADDPSMHFNSTALGQGAATALPIVAGLVSRSNKDASLRSVMNARFPALSEKMLDELDCDRSKSNRNFIQKLFNIKKGTKVTKFKNKRNKGSQG